MAETNKPVPVVPATHARINRDILSDMLMAVGSVLFALSQASAQLAALFPSCKWIGPALMLFASVYKAYLKQRGKQHIQSVDLTPKGGGDDPTVL